MDLDDKQLIVHTDHFTATRLNEVGSYCWTLLKEPQTLDSIVAHLQERYRISAATAREDAENFLGQLTRFGLVEHAS
jgi:hypothetical protein